MTHDQLDEVTEKLFKAVLDYFFSTTPVPPEVTAHYSRRWRPHMKAAFATIISKSFDEPTG